MPVREVQRINAAGGELDPSASGVAESELPRAIASGITKVNIGTDGRLIWTRVHREFFQQSPKVIDFMPPGKTYVEEFAVFLAAKCATLGAAGQAVASAVLAEVEPGFQPSGKTRGNHERPDQI